MRYFLPVQKAYVQPDQPGNVTEKIKMARANWEHLKYQQHVYGNPEGSCRGCSVLEIQVSNYVTDVADGVKNYAWTIIHQELG